MIDLSAVQSFAQIFIHNAILFIDISNYAGYTHTNSHLKLKMGGFFYSPVPELTILIRIYMSHFSYACKTEGENGISCLISPLCINCLSSIAEYSRIIDHSIIWMCIWCGLLQKLHKIKKSELLNSKVSFKL